MNNPISFENETVIGVPATDGKGNIFDKTLVGSYVIFPKSNAPTPFDLSEQEWLDTKKMIDIVKAYIDEHYKPDGYNLGWNIGEVGGQHWEVVHLHIIPRYADEPFAGRGIRSWLKTDENIRPSEK